MLYYMNQNKISAAIDFGEKGIKAVIDEQGEESNAYLSHALLLAGLYQKAARYENAAVLYENVSGKIRNAIGEQHAAYADILNFLALAYEKMYKNNKADSLYQVVLRIRKQTQGELHEDYVLTLRQLGSFYKNSGYYQKALNCYVRAESLLKTLKGESHPDYAACINALGLIYYHLENYEEAEKLFQQSLQILEKSSGRQHPAVANVLNNLGGLYENLADFTKAEQYYREAVSISKKTVGNEHPDYARALNNLALFYKNTGSYEKAEKRLKECLQIEKKVFGERHPQYAITLNNLAGLYETAGNFAAAEKIYLRALDIYVLNKVTHHPDYASLLNNLAGLYETVMKFSKAESLYREALEIRKKIFGEYHTDYAGTLNDLGYLMVQQRKYPLADSFYRASLAIKEKILGQRHPSYLNTLFNLGIFCFHNGKQREGEKMLMAAASALADFQITHQAAMSEKETIAWIEKMNFRNEMLLSLPLYNTLSDSVLQFICNQQLLFKSFTLSELRNALSQFQNSPDSSVRRRFQHWIQLKNKLLKLYSENDTGEAIANTEAEIEAAEKELNEMGLESLKAQARYQLTLEDIGSRLDPDEAAVEFVRFQLFHKNWKDSILYAAFIILPDRKTPVYVPLFEEKQLRKILDSAGRKPIHRAQRLYANYTVKESSAEHPGIQLYRLMWEPLEKYLSGIRKISYSPAGGLYAVAFHALPTHSNRLLMEKYKLKQYVSCREIYFRNKNAETGLPRSIVLFGNPAFDSDSAEMINRAKQNSLQQNISNSALALQNVMKQFRGQRGARWAPLPGTAKETEMIKWLFQDKKIPARTFLLKNASEENFKLLSGNSPEILHVATHGFFLPPPKKQKWQAAKGTENVFQRMENPLLRSGLALAGCQRIWSGKPPVEGAEDGILTAYEISQLNLRNTELAVLSACETGLGDIRGGEGVFGLQRAFKQAGVKKMLLSLWEVPDKETAELMNRFYSYRLNGKSDDEAFFLTQQELKQKYSALHWAAFVLVE
ncbi:MAG: CHAT domain-containing protein [Chitinophagaceae bacterium]|nr:CHAT domain-containing protein [Chitinophagaceae bacterium]